MYKLIPLTDTDILTSSESEGPKVRAFSLYDAPVAPLGSAEAQDPVHVTTTQNDDVPKSSGVSASSSMRKDVTPYDAEPYDMASDAIPSSTVPPASVANGTESKSPAAVMTKASSQRQSNLNGNARTTRSLQGSSQGATPQVDRHGIALHSESDAEQAVQNLSQAGGWWSQNYPQSQNTSSVRVASNDSSSLQWSPPADQWGWNERYQCVFEEAVLTPADMQRRTSELSSLISAFVDTARPLAHTIVNELRLPEEQKTLQPTDGVGGMAGGLKFFSHGIFFKFAVDFMGMYSGDAYAQKAASNELRAINAVAAAAVPNLHHALTTLFFIRGYCVIAAARLPIEAQGTIISGSRDGGHSIHSLHADTEQARSMKRMAYALADHLHLAEHTVMKTELTPIAADAEGHQGVDGRHYLIDLARLLPPTPPLCAVLRPSGTADATDSATESAGTQGRLSKEESVLASLYRTMDTTWDAQPRGSSHLIHQFRPEFMRVLRTQCMPALSSDSLCGWGVHDAKRHHANSVTAMRYLMFSRIPQAVKELVTLHTTKADSVKVIESVISAAASNSRRGSQLVDHLHEFGVNVRYLGLAFMCAEMLHSQLAEANDENKHVFRSVQADLVEEMVARVIKWDILRQCRAVDGTEDSSDTERAHSESFVRWGSALVQQTQAADAFWECTEPDMKAPGNMLPKESESTTLSHTSQSLPTLLQSSFGVPAALSSASLATVRQRLLSADCPCTGSQLPFLLRRVMDLSGVALDPKYLLSATQSTNLSAVALHREISGASASSTASGFSALSDASTQSADSNSGGQQGLNPKAKARAREKAKKKRQKERKKQQQAQENSMCDWKALSSDDIRVAVRVKSIKSPQVVELGDMERQLEEELRVRERVTGRNGVELESTLRALISLYRLWSPATPTTKLGEEPMGVYSALQNQSSRELSLRKAEEYTQRLLEVNRHNFGDHSMEMVRALTHAAETYQHFGNDASAVACFSEALPMAQKIQGLDHPDVGSILNNLAQLHCQNGDHVSALHECQRALHIFQAAFGARHANVGQAFATMGMICYERQMYSEAEEHTSKALQIFDALYVPDSTSAASVAAGQNMTISLGNMAAIVSAQGKHKRAAELCERCMKMEQKVLGPSHPSTLRTANNLAALCRRLGRLDRADQLYEELIASASAQLPPMHPDMGFYLTNLGRLREDQRQYGQCLQLLQRARDIFVTNYGEQNHRAQEVENQIARVRSRAPAALLKVQLKQLESQT